MLLLCLLMACAGPEAAEQAAKTDGTPPHLADNPECSACHTVRDHFPERTAGSGCQSCHAADPKSGRMTKVSPENIKPVSAFEEEVALDNTPVDRVEMYYDETRIGDQPNEMILIPEGEFLMGSDERLSDEGPMHTVQMKSYYIDKYEVTNLQYKKFIDARHKKAPSHFKNRTYPPGKVDHPVTEVSWYDAKAYCEWAGKRLPTEQEWEKAARGTDGRMFPWGQAFDINSANTPVRWGRLDERGDTTPVGSFKAGVSPYGLYDMSGNVWEWTSSWYMPHPGNTKKSENYGELYKILKGGSWWDCSFYKCGISAPVFNRSFFNRRVKNSSFGFRCAKDAG